MAEDAPLDSATRSRRPVIAMPTNKVTVALPFSRITLAELVQELAELAAIVSELAALVEATVAEPAATQLRLRAQALAVRVRRRLSRLGLVSFRVRAVAMVLAFTRLSTGISSRSARSHLDAPPKHDTRGVSFPGNVSLNC